MEGESGLYEVLFLICKLLGLLLFIDSMTASPLRPALCQFRTLLRLQDDTLGVAGQTDDAGVLA